MRDMIPTTLLTALLRDRRGSMLTGAALVSGSVSALLSGAFATAAPVAVASTPPAATRAEPAHRGRPATYLVAIARGPKLVLAAGAVAEPLLPASARAMSCRNVWRVLDVSLGVSCSDVRLEAGGAGI